MGADVTSATIVTVIAGMAIVNFAVRFTPLAILSRLDLPAPLRRWLSFVPISVMGALLASEVLRPGGRWQPPATNPGVYAAFVAAGTFRLTRSFLGSTLAGVASFVALRAIM